MILLEKLRKCMPVDWFKRLLSFRKKLNICLGENTKLQHRTEKSNSVNKLPSNATVALLLFSAGTCLGFFNLPHFA